MYIIQNKYIHQLVKMKEVCHLVFYVNRIYELCHNAVGRCNNFCLTIHFSFLVTNVKVFTIEQGDDNELNRLAADRIKSVELILVPGPEYPQGTNAVVKIKTIRHEQGLSVEVASNENWFNRFSHEQDLDLNYRIGKWDIFAAAEYGKYKTKEKNENLYFTKNINPAYTLTDYSDRNYIYANTGINYSDDKKHSAELWFLKMLNME